MNLVARMQLAMTRLEARVEAREVSTNRGEREIYADLHERLARELAPRGHIQNMLAARVIAAAWRLAKAERIEVGIFDMTGSNPVMRAVMKQAGSTVDPMAAAFTQQQTEIGAASRYVAAAERSFHTALREYRREQAGQ